jgi:hypothetical protein
MCEVEAIFQAFSDHSPPQYVPPPDKNGQQFFGRFWGTIPETCTATPSPDASRLTILFDGKKSMPAYYSKM